MKMTYTIKTAARTFTATTAKEALAVIRANGIRMFAGEAALIKNMTPGCSTTLRHAYVVCE